jgi:hypothetical protein
VTGPTGPTGPAGPEPADSIPLATGGTMQGSLLLDSNNLINLASPVSDSDVATKSYVDTVGSEPLLIIAADPTPALINTTYNADTSGGAFNITLPTGVPSGSRITIIDHAGTFATNPVTLVPSGNDKVQDEYILRDENQAVTLMYDTNLWYSTQGTRTLSTVGESPNYGLLKTSATQTITDNEVLLTTVGYLAGNLSKVGNGIALRANSLYRVSIEVYYTSSVDNVLEVRGSTSGAITTLQVEDANLYNGSVATSRSVYLTTTAVDENLTVHGINSSNAFTLDHINLEVQEVNRYSLNLCMITFLGSQSVTNQTLTLDTTATQQGNLVKNGNAIDILSGNLYKITALVETSSVPNTTLKSFRIRGTVSGDLNLAGQLTNKGPSSNACANTSVTVYHTPALDESITLDADDPTATSVDVIRASLEVVQVKT